MMRAALNLMAAAALLTVLTSLQGLLTTLSQRGTRGYPYNYNTVPFLA